jgi:carbon monoxide dehydrogenase subunit G
MATFKSEKVTINTTSKSLFDFLSNLNNLEGLMPLDKISEWQSTETECSFKIPNLGKIGFKHDTFTEPSQIKLVSLSDKPFGFSMDFNITENGDSTSAQIIVDANLNPMLKMMVEKPLTAFFNGIAKKLANKSF